MTGRKSREGARALKRWRESQGLSHGAAGERIDVSRVAVLEYERGSKVPPLQRALTIEQVTDGAVRIETFGYGPDVVALIRAAVARRAA